ncbi:hypothetical protein KXV85_011209, partial [Aspergillus fumigatus]
NQNWHRDSSEPLNFVRIFVPLENIATMEDGPTALIPGTSGMRDYFEVRRFSDDELTQVQQEKGAGVVMADVGDVYFVNTFCIHRGPVASHACDLPHPAGTGARTSARYGGGQSPLLPLSGEMIMAAVKLIIWDLDDTLWRGTLADGDAVALFPARADLIRALNARGVVNSICSKNDHARAEAQLREMGLWDEFVFPHIAFTPKPEAIAGIISAMQLRPANVLFIDDNIHNLAGAQAALPEIQILDANAPDADERLAHILAAQPEGSRSRVGEYRQLEAKWRDRA